MQATSWTGTTLLLKAQQLELRERVSLAPHTGPIRQIAGADVSLIRGSSRAWAGLVVLDYETLEVIDAQGIEDVLSMPYIPGYLSFREVPLLWKAWSQLAQKPDVVMVDGHGILHPRRLGVATHFGLVAGVPTVGCAKRRLVGDGEMPPNSAMEIRPVLLDGEPCGFSLRSRLNANPIYVSPGTGVSVEQSLDITQHCLRGYRLPEPTRLAHAFVNRFRKECG